MWKILVVKDHAMEGDMSLPQHSLFPMHISLSWELVGLVLWMLHVPSHFCMQSVYFPSLQVRLHFLASQVCTQSWSLLLHSRSISHTSTALPHVCVLQFVPLQVRLHFPASQVCTQSWSWLLHSRSISHTSTLLPHVCVLQFVPLQVRLHFSASQVCTQSWSWLLHSRSISHTSTLLPHVCVLQFVPLQFRIHFSALQVWSQSLPSQLLKAKTETTKTRTEPKIQEYQLWK